MMMTADTLMYNEGARDNAVRVAKSMHALGKETSEIDFTLEITEEEAEKYISEK